MRYAKPEVSELPNAVSAVQAGDSISPHKEDGPTDGIVEDMTTVAAYIADE